jgi:hypothetical protein
LKGKRTASDLVSRDVMTQDSSTENCPLAEINNIKEKRHGSHSFFMNFYCTFYNDLKRLGARPVESKHPTIKFILYVTPCLEARKFEINFFQKRIRFFFENTVYF